MPRRKLSGRALNHRENWIRRGEVSPTEKVGAGVLSASLQALNHQASLLFIDLHHSISAGPAVISS